MSAYGPGARPSRRIAVLPRVLLSAVLAAFAFIVGAPSPAAGAPEARAGSAALAGQAAPSERSGDPDRTALEKEKLRAEIAELKSRTSVPWTSYATLVSAVAGVLAVVAGFRSLSVEARKDRSRREDERFQMVVSGFGSPNDRAWVGAAVVVREFLQPGREQFHLQAFDFVVAHLKSTGNNSLALNHALITAFKEGFPRVRDELQRTRGLAHPDELGRYLDVSRVRLDGAFLWKADLRNVWMPEASLEGTDLSEADLGGARLWKGNLRKIKLRQADLSEGDLGCADLAEAELSEANLRRAGLWATHLVKAKLWGADLTDARLCRDPGSGANLTEADLRKATLCNADLRDANLQGASLEGANLEGANLEGAKFDGAKYNSRTMRLEQGGELTPTRWPGAVPPGAHDTTP